MSKGQQPLLEPALFQPLMNLVEKYGIKNLVETGTGPSSSGMEAASRLGLHGYSCDVYRPCVERARELYPNFRIFWSESLAMFEAVLPTLEGPTFFWLDGHCPTDHACLPGQDFPVYDELQAIRRLKPGFERDVIWIDDIAMIDVPDNPVAVRWDVMLAGRRWQGEKSRSWAEYLAVLSDTHDAEVVGGELLTLTPK